MVSIQKTVLNQECELYLNLEKYNSLFEITKEILDFVDLKTSPICEGGPLPHLSNSDLTKLFDLDVHFAATIAETDLSFYLDVTDLVAHEIAEWEQDTRVVRPRPQCWPNIALFSLWVNILDSPRDWFAKFRGLHERARLRVAQFRAALEKSVFDQAAQADTVSNKNIPKKFVDLLDYWNEYQSESQQCGSKATFEKFPNWLKNNQKVFDANALKQFRAWKRNFRVRSKR